MEMLNAEFVFVLELLNLFQGSFLVVLLVLCGRFDTRLQLLANEKDLTVLVV
jgi:hypothetical protein